MRILYIYIYIYILAGDQIVKAKTENDVWQTL